MPTPPRTLRSPRRRAAAVTAVGTVAALILALALAACGSSGGTTTTTLPPPVHRTGPETIFTPSNPLYKDPPGTVDYLKRLGVDRIRLFLTWNKIAPDPHALRAPAGFDAGNPSAYPQANWAIYDTIIRTVLAKGLSLDLVLGPPAPRWAAGPGAPNPAKQTWWKPSASAYEQFVQAAGARYSGHYTPPGATTPLPRVDFWSIWNEPNLGFQLAPQTTDNHTVEESAILYRRLADAAWTGLHASGHGHDTILIGELGPAGSLAAPGDFNAMPPLRFLRALYCVGADYKPLTGPAATVRECPATAAASKTFPSQHPILFHATAYADHPYPQGLPPDKPTPDEPDYTELADIPNLLRALDTLQQVYGSHRRYDVYSTEFGYITSPPNEKGGGIDQHLAAMYINWAEYITWRQPRLVSYDQYLITDPPPDGTAVYGNFSSGLVNYNGVPKPGLAAFRLPIFLPVTKTGAKGRFEVWGCVRPAHYAQSISHRPQVAQIQFQRGSRGAFKTVDRVKITDRYGYFDVFVAFPSSGSVRLRWSYPGGPTVYSRTVAVTVG